MKTAFNLTPHGENISTLSLLIEAGWYGVSFAWYKKDPLSLEGILSYNFNERIAAAELASNIDFITGKEPVFTAGVNEISVFYNFRESLLVPGKYYDDSDSSGQLATIFGSSLNNIIRTDIIHYDTGIANSEDIHNIYSIPVEIHTAFTKNFPGAAIRHSTSMQLQHNDTAEIQCIIFHNMIKVILYNNGQLQLVQQFHYKAPEDVAYHLLNACDKYEVDVSKVVLLLCGMIDINSNLYHELYKYFLNISFQSVSDEVFLTDGIKAFPAHFFSHLTALAKCVS